MNDDDLMKSYNKLYAYYKSTYMFIFLTEKLSYDPDWYRNIFCKQIGFLVFFGYPFIFYCFEYHYYYHFTNFGFIIIISSLVYLDVSGNA